MESKTIKISKENYLWLLRLAAEMQKNSENLVSFDSALSKIRGSGKERKRLSDLAGRWKMSDEEAKKFLKDARKGWKKWKIQSF